MRSLLFVLALLFSSSAFAGQPPAAAAVAAAIAALRGKPGGLLGADYQGHAPVSAALRAPTQFDDINAGYLPNNAWYWNNLYWVMLDNTAGKAVWQRLVLPLACDQYACNGAWGHMKARAGYNGPSAHLVRIDALNGAGLDIGWNGNYIDAAAANAFCAGATNTAVVGAENCEETISYDQIGANNESHSNYLTGTANLTAGGSGYTNGTNQHLTLASTGGVCPTPTIINADVVGNAVTTTNFSIFQQGYCTLAPSQPQTVTGGTGTVTVKYNSAANFWAMIAGLTNPGTGYTSGNNQHLTLASTNGVCPTPTIINANVSGGVINTTNWSIFQQGICYVLPTQPQAVTGGSGGTVTVGYYSSSPKWIASNTVNNVIGARAFNSFQFATGAGTSQYNPVSVYTNIPAAMTWTPNNSTWAFVGENVSAGLTASAIITNDTNYGFMFGASNSMNLSVLGAVTPGTVGNGDNCGVFKEADPAVTLFTWSGTTFTCRENNVVGTYTTGTYAGGVQAGGTEGFAGTPAFTALKPNNRVDDNVLSINFSSALTTQQQTNVTVSLAAEAQIAAQIRDFLNIVGGSFSMGATGFTGNSPSQYVSGMYQRPLKVYNLSQYGQSLLSEINSFSSGSFGEARVYLGVETKANSVTWSYQGLDNDVNNLQGNGLGATSQEQTLHGYIMNYRYDVKTLPTAGQTPINLVWGIPPINCLQQNDALALPLLNVLLPDEEANWSNPAPANCTTLTSCTSGGMGMDGFVNYFRLPLIGGVNALTAGAFPIATSPNVPFCNATYSTGNKHPNDLSQSIMGPALKQAVDGVLPQ